MPGVFSISSIESRRTAGASRCETATSQGRPSSVPCETSKRPAAKKARYGTIGSSARQRYVVVSPRAIRLTRRPLAMTCLPRGTVIAMSTSALSSGWSLAGNHHGAMCGWFIATTSWSLASQLCSPR